MLLTLMLSACFNQTYKVDNFNADALKWYKPFARTDTVIFASDKNERDTIIFQKVKSSKDSTKGYEQGNTKTNYLTVPYQFTKGSYHQFAIMGDGKTRYDQNILNMMKSSSGYGSLEIVFIGTYFIDEYLKNIQKINDSIYFFDSNKAQYQGLDVEKGIKDFTFNTHIGITGYTDDRNIKWIRK